MRAYPLIESFGPPKVELVRTLGEQGPLALTGEGEPLIFRVRWCDRTASFAGLIPLVTLPGHDLPQNITERPYA